MALVAMDECVRNLVCTGADPARIAVLDNFCWPSCRDPRNLGALVRAAEGCYDGAKAYRTPFISGKDSLNNQFTTEDSRTIQIPPTLLISGIGIVPDVRRCVTMDAKRAGSRLILVGETGAAMGGSHYELLCGAAGGAARLPDVDLDRGPRAAAAVHDLIRRGIVLAAHDPSEGGLLVAAAEMAFAGNLGLALDLARVPRGAGASATALAFAETPGRYLLEVRSADAEEVVKRLADLPHAIIGEFNDGRRFVVADAEVDLPVESLLQAWLAPLDW
jgi:phosphoribosylformylglycinamidine synthase